MPTGQQYATNVPQTFITGQINPTATVMSVNSSSGWPSVFPFTAVLEIGTSLQEPIDVTNISGTTWTIVRAIDSTVGFTHNPNATVTHADIGRDFRESRSHIDASSTPDAVGHSVHGLANGSSVVGTTDLQTISGKTLSAPSFTGTVTMGSGTWSGSGPLTEQTLSVAGLTGAAAATTRFAGTTTLGGPPTTGTFVTGDIVFDQKYGTYWICGTGGTPGTWGLAGTDVQFSSISLSVAQSSIVFNLPSGLFNRVRVEFRARSDAAAVPAEQLYIRINGDSGNNYLWQIDQANNNTVAGQSAGAFTSRIQVATIPAATATANYFGTGEFIVSETNTTGAVISVAGYATAIANATNSWSGTYGGIWGGAGGPVTSVTLFAATGNLTAGSRFSIIGSQ